MASDNNVFRIGIAMAGAVSAGAYTAGVMDYLLQTLTKWDAQKRIIRDKIKQGQPLTEVEASVPLHDVIIDVMGGASAGGMTAAITSLALFEGITPYQDTFKGKSQVPENKLYDSWVNLSDQQGLPTLYQMFDNADIKKDQYVHSVLNSSPIDKIADRAVEGTFTKSLPPFINPNLEVILTITSLRGIPLGINFFDEDIPKLQENLAKLNEELAKCEAQMSGQAGPAAPTERGASYTPQPVAYEVDLDEIDTELDRMKTEQKEIKEELAEFDRLIDGINEADDAPKSEASAEVIEKQFEQIDQVLNELASDKVSEVIKESEAVISNSEESREKHQGGTSRGVDRSASPQVSLEDTKSRIQEQIKKTTLIIAKKRKWSKSQPAHRMHMHKGVAHFRLQQPGAAAQKEKKYAHTIAFDPNSENDRTWLMESAKATGAFPIGLRSRSLKGTSSEYLKAQIYRNFDAKLGQQEQRALKNVLSIGLEKDSPFDFVAVDGGTVNNEPFGEVIRVMEDGSSEQQKNYAIIMIDPFPNFEGDELYVEPKTLGELVPSLVGAIRGQALLKEGDILRGLSKDHTRKMVFPSRKDKNNKKMKYPIACGALAGFSGFFSKSFREHDFQLGRKNCQSFLRKHFTIVAEKADNMNCFSNWSPDQEARYRLEKDDLGEKKYVYTIIPDMDHKVPGLAEQQPELVPFEWPFISPEAIYALNDPLKERFQLVLKNIMNSDPERAKAALEAAQKNKHVVDLWLKEQFPQSWFARQWSSFIAWTISGLWRTFGTSWLAEKASRAVIRHVLKDFHLRKLLDQDYVHE